MNATHATSPLPALRRDAPNTLTPRVLQFGQGNFLRAFADWMFDLLNERSGLDAGVVVVRPTGRSDAPLLDTQGGVYTTLVRGLDDSGQAVREFRRIGCVLRELDLKRHFDDYLAVAREPSLRFVVSNTTEAGIAINDTDRFDDRPPATFPAKLARWLHARFRHFDGQAERGVVVLPCELIDHNGPALRDAVLHFARLWQLEDEFVTWLQRHCAFHSTLVDRIVPGRPDAEMALLNAELGYEDRFLVAAEHYYLWVIEAPAALADELRLAGAGLRIALVDDITPFKQRKVGILNGGHTCLVPVALLAGIDSVGAAMDDAQLRAFLEATLREEIVPVLPLPRESLLPFVDDVLRRFANPYIHHRLASIALNSWSKFAARVMPQLLGFQAQQGRLPARLVLALAATMHLYRGERLQLADDAATLAWFRDAWVRKDTGEWHWKDLAVAWLAWTPVWGRDLNECPGLTAALATDLERIARLGMRRALDPPA